jgi:hypothetical protein
MPQDSVKTRFGIIEEATWGTTPASAVQLVNLSEFPDLSLSRNTGMPDVIGSANPRRSYAARALQEDGNLSLTAGLQFANMRLLWEAALMNDQGTATTASGSTFQATAATGVITDSGSGFGNLSVGDMVYIYGTDWISAGNTAGWYGPLSAAAAGSITIPSAQIGNDVGPSGDMNVDSTPLKDGDTPRSFSVEWEAQDLTTDFRSGTGYKVQSHSWSWAQNDFARESCTLIGQAPLHATSTIGTGGPTASPTTDFMDCVTNFGTIYIDEAATTYIVSSWEMTINVELGPYYGLGNRGPAGITEARIMPEFSATIIYDDNSKALLDDIEGLTTISMFWDVVDAGGNRVCWSLPAMRPETGDPGGGAPGTNLEFRNLRFTAHDPEKDSTSAYYSSSFDYLVGIFEA